jgi:hypothetical protein
MDARAAISVDEYLRTSFADFDREFQDGELVARFWPANYMAERRF